MKPLELVRPGEHLNLLCVGAHADDIEIGSAGSILTWFGIGVRLSVIWCVASADAGRELEARESMAALMAEAEECVFHPGGFRDGYLPYEGAAVKEWVESLREINPDMILVHRSEDAHQDHRLLSELVSTVFRDHMVLEYEIPKWDGDLGRPNLYVPISADNLERKINLLDQHFNSQTGKDWFDGETFRAIARLRGVECRAPERYAEAFWLRKAVAAATPNP